MLEMNLFDSVDLDFMLRTTVVFSVDVYRLQGVLEVGHEVLAAMQKIVRYQCWRLVPIFMSDITLFGGPI
jgi:hypothetical protein